MKKTAIALTLVFALVFSGCAANAEIKPTEKPTAEPVVFNADLMAGIQPKRISAGSTVSDSTAFALNLLKTTFNGSNTVISPASAYLALSMVANGAKGDTLKEFESVLGAPVGDLNSSCIQLMEALNNTSDRLTLKTVNGIWYNNRHDFKVNPDFLQTNADYFGAAEFASDFSKPETLKAINQFVSDNTNKLIPAILDQLDPDGIMVLVNTLYFKGKWESPFKPESTENGGFTLADGKTTQTPTMEQTMNSARYFDVGDARGIILPYQGGRFAYVAVMPSAGVEDYLSSLTPDAFKSLTTGAENKKVQLFIPKFSVTGNFDLNPILQHLGLQLAFDPNKADFSALGTADNNIYIGKAIQKVVFKLNEEGTQAAAATAVEMEAGSMPMPQENPIILRLDHPFIYALMDMQTGAPLFLGVMENPTLS